MTHLDFGPNYVKGTRQYTFDIPAVDSSRSIELIALVDIYKSDPGDAYLGLYGSGTDPTDLFFANGSPYMTSHTLFTLLRADIRKQIEGHRGRSYQKTAGIRSTNSPIHHTFCVSWIRCCGRRGLDRMVWYETRETAFE
jgi:hypothetical protein